MYSHISGSKDIATITNVGAGVKGAVDNAVGISFGKVVSDDVGEAVGSVLGISIGAVGVAVDRMVSAGVGDAVGIEFSRDVRNILMAINTFNVKRIIGKTVKRNTLSFLLFLIYFLP